MLRHVFTSEQTFPLEAGGSLDGTEIVAIIADKKSVFSVGEVVMFINLFIFTAAGFLFEWEQAM